MPQKFNLFCSLAASVCLLLPAGLQNVHAETYENGVYTDDCGQTAAEGSEFYRLYNADGSVYYMYPGLSYEYGGTIFSKACNWSLYFPASNTSCWLQPDFSNGTAWNNPANPFNVDDLRGQCTWFNWCRFVEIYGFDPGFYDDGWLNASEIVNSHPDRFYLSSMPATGAVFSSDQVHNHCGMVLYADETGSNLIIQEGNLDGISNPDLTSACNDYWTRSVSLDQLRAMYGDVVFANPYC